MNLLFKIIAIGLVVCGAFVVYSAKMLVSKFNLSDKQTVKAEVDEEKMEELKSYKAIAKVKAVGGLIFLPGMIMILILFK